MTTLTFQNTAMTVINQNNQTYISSSDLALALQYQHTNSIAKIYERNSDEFTADMTTVVKLTTNGINGSNRQIEQRIFSLRGAHLIAMFARTKVAKEFRRWVLDILDRETNQPKQLALHQPEKTFTIECTERELQLMSWLWFIALRGVETMKMIHPAMEKLGSRYSAAIYGQAFEYNHLIRDGHKLIQKLTAKFEYDYESNWRVVKHIKNYNPKGNNSHVI